MRVCLLDLNYTLISNSRPGQKSTKESREAEEYDTELLEMLKEDFDEIILVTARPNFLRTKTLARIKSKIGYEFKATYFNGDYGIGPTRPNIFKAQVFAKIRDKYTPDTTFNGVESNPKTRSAYATLGVRSASKPMYKQHRLELFDR